jgi:hypothetical protein
MCYAVRIHVPGKINVILRLVGSPQLDPTAPALTSREIEPRYHARLEQMTGNQVVF